MILDAAADAQNVFDLFPILQMLARMLHFFGEFPGAADPLATSRVSNNGKVFHFKSNQISFIVTQTQSNMYITFEHELCIDLV